MNENVITKVIYGYMPNNEISKLEYSEFVEECRKYKLGHIAFNNYDHVVSEKAYADQNVKKTTLTNGQHGPNGSGTASNFCSHIAMWRLCVELNVGVAILEHDARPVVNFLGLPVLDDEIVLLGPRLSSLQSYKFPGEPMSFFEVEHHAGSHAYAISPNTARKLIEHVETLGVCDSIDQWIFLRLKEHHVGKYINLKMQACDPPVVVAPYMREGKEKESSVGRSKGPKTQPTYNLYETPGFIRGKVSE